jgi:hypothetical protein
MSQNVRVIPYAARAACIDSNPFFLLALTMRRRPEIETHGRTLLNFGLGHAK